MADKSKKFFTDLEDMDIPKKLTKRNANDMRNFILEELAKTIKEEKELFDKKQEYLKLWQKKIKEHKEIDKKLVEFYDRLRFLEND